MGKNKLIHLFWIHIQKQNLLRLMTEQNSINLTHVARTPPKFPPCQRLWV